jgi:hypothetical protein
MIRHICRIVKLTDRVLLTYSEFLRNTQCVSFLDSRKIYQIKGKVNLWKGNFSGWWFVVLLRYQLQVKYLKSLETKFKKLPLQPVSFIQHLKHHHFRHEQPSNFGLLFRPLFSLSDSSPDHNSQI